MRFIRSVQQIAAEGPEDDPIAGVAQLFDVSIAFIVAVIAALFTLMSSKGLLNNSTQRVSHKSEERTMSGNGVRLGTAYRLNNGQVVYVPDSTK
jgi:hypothetical protein